MAENIPQQSIIAIDQARQDFKTSLTFRHKPTAILVFPLLSTATVVTLTSTWNAVAQNQNITLGAMMAGGMAVLYLPVFGMMIRDKQLSTIEKEKRNYNIAVDNEIRHLKHLAHESAVDALVADTNNAVRKNGKITLAELAKLVNVDTEKFRRAEAKLAITVLQTKLILAIHRGYITDFNIPNFIDRDLKPEIPTHHRYLASDLWKEYDSRDGKIKSAEIAELVNLLPASSTNPVTSNTPPQPLVRAFVSAVSNFFAEGRVIQRTGIALSNGIKGLGEFYIDGLTAYWDILAQSYDPDKHLPPVPTTIPTPVLSSVEDLDKIIKGYHGPIDLPALART